MVKQVQHTVDIRRIKKVTPYVEEYALGNDFLLGDFRAEHLEKHPNLLTAFQHPFRFDGFMFFFLRKGYFSLDMNLNSYQMLENSLLVVMPGSIVRFTAGDFPDPDLDLLFVLVSRDFVSNIPFDFNKVFQDSMRMLKNPCIHLKGDAFSLAIDYMRLTRSLMRSRHSNKREIIGSLLTSFLYIVTDLWSTRKEEELLVGTKGNTRLSQLFERFIALVTEHHCEERTVAFYADKLCLTPKYLSRLVREASGRSAPDWIDAFVILEAKNLLKYSDKSIKEIVFALNFPNQSVFYKFFKAHTGLTPSQFRKE